ncbi:hypothetical protein QW060_20035 [Myroides ceti]|uniref:Uncharacterized protein n=1 Tax=Paenimyroides ceti TaxID=395087 RepID=A0ABT8CXN3_9FLAO|nr:hypothetical protein [Paenimyroides ceti]MDN3709309.1 hypothetical protein [Paenimyroides ceti]
MSPTTKAFLANANVAAPTSGETCRLRLRLAGLCSPAGWCIPDASCFCVSDKF